MHNPTKDWRKRVFINNIFIHKDFNFSKKYLSIKEYNYKAAHIL